MYVQLAVCPADKKHSEVSQIMAVIALTTNLKLNLLDI